MTSARPFSSRCQVILFDMDGVLVDVTNSYRKAIQQTVRFFTGKPALSAQIQLLKEKGGYNNDWDLTEMILLGRGKMIPKVEIVRKFQEFYWGSESKRGLIDREKWLLPKEKLMKLHKKNCLGIVTGRPREETLYTLKKFRMDNVFDVLVTMEDYSPEKAKPDPYPIKLALERICIKEGMYVGDSVDDIRAAKYAGLEPIGCIPPHVSAGQLKVLMLKNGARKVLNRITDINEVV